MASKHRFPQSLSPSNFREPSFSLYLTEDDKCSLVKLAEPTRSKSEYNGRVSIDEEISAFSAYKYFNGVVNRSQRHKQPNGNGLQRCDTERKVNIATAFSLVRSKFSLGTPSIRSESSCRVSTQVTGRRSPSDMQKKTLWSSFSCKCSCDTIEVDDQLRKRASLKELVRADQLLEVGATLPRKLWMTNGKVVLCPSARTSLLDIGLASPVSSAVKNLSPRVKDSISSVNSFDVPPIGKTRKSMSHARILNLLNWDSFCSRPKDVNIPSVEYCTDAESVSSSDLFEIDSFTRNDGIPSISDQVPDIGASGYTTPTTYYSPSEANID